MGIFNRLFGGSKNSESTAKGSALTILPQNQLSNLASILPMVLKLVSTPHSQTIVVREVSEADVLLVRSLSDEQFVELMEIQEVYCRAQEESDQARKLKLYQTLVDWAPWHPFGIKSLGVCHYMTGNRKKAHELLKRAAQLAPDNENIMANLRRVESEL